MAVFDVLQVFAEVVEEVCDVPKLVVEVVEAIQVTRNVSFPDMNGNNMPDNLELSSHIIFKPVH